MPERTEAIRELAEAEAAVAGGLSDVGTKLDDLLAGLEYDRDVRRRFGIASIVVAIVFFTGLGYNVWNGYQGATARRQLLRETAQVQRTSNEVHSAVTPGQPVYQQGQAAQAGAITELDCRYRRGLAHLPLPDPTRPCIAQTPPEVLNP